MCSTVSHFTHVRTDTSAENKYMNEVLAGDQVKDEIKQAFQTHCKCYITYKELLHNQDARPSINVTNKIPVMA